MEAILYSKTSSFFGPVSVEASFVEAVPLLYSVGIGTSFGLSCGLKKSEAVLEVVVGGLDSRASKSKVEK